MLRVKNVCTRIKNVRTIKKTLRRSSYAGSEMRVGVEMKLRFFVSTKLENVAATVTNAILRTYSISTTKILLKSCST